MEELREKIIAQAKKYFGVPYARKYWPPHSPEYASPIFLDCCGLVRQVMRDLQTEMGFQLGPWNQAYMYDTLPDTVAKDQMKPGDLVFMSGVYVNPKRTYKRQLHNMVHVEIWLGEGDKTIGSRWNNGKVQVFDSYQFSPKSFTSEQYIFKSIDTWLMGICRSHCPQHPWRLKTRKPHRKSVFNVEDTICDEKASDESDDSWQVEGVRLEDDDNLDISNSMPLSENVIEDREHNSIGGNQVLRSKGLAETGNSEIDIYMIRTQNTFINTKLCVFDHSFRETPIQNSKVQSYGRNHAQSSNTAECFRDQPISKTKQSQEFLVYIRRITRRNQSIESVMMNIFRVDVFYNFVMDVVQKLLINEQILNIQRDGGSGDTYKDTGEGREGIYRRDRRPAKLTPCCLPTNMQPTFFIGGGNGISLVEGPLLALGWRRTADRYDERFKLKWVENKSRINYLTFREGEQLVNHIPNCKLLTNKLGLLCSLQEYERITLLTKGRLPRLRMADFVPETYKLDDKVDREKFIQEYKDGETWICKPTGMNQGKGIFLLRSKEKVDQLLGDRDAKLNPKLNNRGPLLRIVQRYICHPLLLEGRKFDIRSYMFIASTVPFLVLYHKGYVRLSCHKYSPEDNNLTIHLTNQFVQKKDPAYKDLKEDTAWTMDKLNDYINEHVAKEKGLEQDWVYGKLTKQMQRITLHCFNSVKHKLQCRMGYFDLYGLDFMVDSDMKVWLIEINANPALHTNCQALKDAIPSVVEEAIYLALECFEKSCKGQPLMPLNSLASYSVLYCGSSPNTAAHREIRSVSPFKDITIWNRSSGRHYMWLMSIYTKVFITIVWLLLMLRFFLVILQKSRNVIHFNYESTVNLHSVGTNQGAFLDGTLACLPSGAVLICLTPVWDGICYKIVLGSQISLD
ncbi:unnamed protein product [Candidula unifasciata]|uniref:NlpC/P60 domain-containing protein n=1 Tax=Candidula unifasciata TaxID=100452 RepID=A0A8S3Z6H6_9EUPU|nr:unnamed protein product [Candidula unifasciata]